MCVADDYGRHGGVVYVVGCGAAVVNGLMHESGCLGEQELGVLSCVIYSGSQALARDVPAVSRLL